MILLNQCIAINLKIYILQILLIKLESNKKGANQCSL